MHTKPRKEECLERPKRKNTGRFLRGQSVRINGNTHDVSNNQEGRTGKKKKKHLEGKKERQAVKEEHTLSLRRPEIKTRTAIRKNPGL